MVHKRFLVICACIMSLTGVGQPVHACETKNQQPSPILFARTPKKESLIESVITLEKVINQRNRIKTFKHLCNICLPIVTTALLTHGAHQKKFLNNSMLAGIIGLGLSTFYYAFARKKLTNRIVKKEDCIKICQDTLGIEADGLLPFQENNNQQTMIPFQNKKQFLEERALIEVLSQRNTVHRSPEFQEFRTTVQTKMMPFDELVCNNAYDAENHNYRKALAPYCKQQQKVVKEYIKANITEMTNTIQKLENPQSENDE